MHILHHLAGSGDKSRDEKKPTCNRHVLSATRDTNTREWNELIALQSKHSLTHSHNHGSRTKPNSSVTESRRDRSAIMFLELGGLLLTSSVGGKFYCWQVLLLTLLSVSVSSKAVCWIFSSELLLRFDKFSWRQIFSTSSVGGRFQVLCSWELGGCVFIQQFFKDIMNRCNYFILKFYGILMELMKKRTKRKMLKTKENEMNNK